MAVLFVAAFVGVEVVGEDQDGHHPLFSRAFSCVGCASSRSLAKLPEQLPLIVNVLLDNLPDLFGARGPVAPLRIVLGKFPILNF